MIRAIKIDFSWILDAQTPGVRAEVEILYGQNPLIEAHLSELCELVELRARQGCQEFLGSLTSPQDMRRELDRQILEGDR